MALQDTDLLLVQRGTQSYKLTGANAKSFLGGDLQAVTDRGSTTTNGATFGGGNISLSANGSATFIGTVKQGTFNGGQTTASGSVFIDGGGVMTQFEAATTAATNRAFVVYHGGNEQIEFKGDGSGSFAGSVQSLSWPTTGYQLEGSGALGINAAAGTTGNIVALKVDGTSVASITGQGDAEFDGEVSAGDFSNTASIGSLLSATGAVMARAQAGNQAIWNGLLGTTSTSQVTADGNARFNGQINTNNDGNGVSADNCVSIRNSRVYSRNDSGTASSNAFAVFKGGDQASNIVATIKGDGSAEFAGNIDVNGGVNGLGSSIFADGRIYGKVVYAQGSVGNGILFQGLTSGGDEVFRVGLDGSGSFARTVQAGSTTAGNYGILAYSNAAGTNTYASVKARQYGTGRVWSGCDASDNVTSSISANGSAVFNSRVSGSVANVTSSGTFDLQSSNYWRVDGPGLNNPSAATAGQSGVFYCVGEVNSFGNQYSFPGGETPTIPANSVVPYFVDTDNKIRIGIATEAFV